MAIARPMQMEGVGATAVCAVCMNGSARIPGAGSERNTITILNRKALEENSNGTYQAPWR
jgi:hypothetical protein